MRRWSAPLVVLALGFAACSSDGDGEPDPTVPTRPTTAATTPAAADIATIPQVIDEPYLNRVLAAFDSLETEATRLIAGERRLGTAALQLLDSIYADEEFNQQTDAWLRALDGSPNLTSTGRSTSVDRVISSSGSCVFLAVARSYPEGETLRSEYLALAPLDPASDPGHRNPTAWMITTSGSRSDGNEPSDPCQR